MKAKLKEFGEWIMEVIIFWSIFILIVGSVLLNAFLICFTLVMWSKGSESSMAVGALACLVCFFLSKSLICRALIGKGRHDGY